MTTPHLIEDLKRDEGLRLKAYEDTQGVWTIGYGHAHVAPGTIWTQGQAEDVLASDAALACATLDQHVGWWRNLDDARQDVLANLCFNMGWGDGARGLSSFHHTLELIRTGQYGSAAITLLASQWAREVKGRANRLAAQLRSGEHVQ